MSKFIIFCNYNIYYSIDCKSISNFCQLNFIKYFSISQKRGGNLRGVRGYKPGQNPIMYVDKIIYDLYGQKISEINGNGIRTEYTYNPLNRRLTNLKNYSSNIVLQDNIYTYDNVGNIIRIRDNGMHSREQIYTYDALYRLIDSRGQWNNEPLTYETSLSYSPSGRIINKEMDSKRLNNTYGTYPVNYKNTYLYNPNNPYAVTLITNNITGRDIRFAWDSKGNMLHSYDEAMRIERNLCWTEDNRLQAFVERDAHIMSSQEIKNNLESGSLTHADVTGMAAYYNYDASGERNLKITSPNNNVLQNSNNTYLSSLVYPTLYASPLITLHHKGYTKHYFDGDRRICSKIGGGFGNVNWERVNDSIKTISLDYLTQIENQQRGIHSTFHHCLNSDVEINTRYDLFEILKHHEQDRNEYEPTFYYHSDHLGSAAYLTNQAGSVFQALNYLPFGEEWVDVKQDIGWPSLINYSFNAKEKDYETGFHYYGSRYYSSELSIWNSTDPMADKYPSLTPYNYCANNPVKLIDPNGEDIWEINQEGKILNQIKTKKYDKFVIKNNDGDVISESKKYEYGTVTLMVKKHNVNTTKKDDNGNSIPYNIDIYKIKGEKNSNELFQFFAIYANQSEWSQTFVGNSNTSYNFLSTSHIENSEVGGSFISGESPGWGYTLREHRHSHPYSAFPSKSDKKFAIGKQGIPLKIFYKGTLYEYDANGLTGNKFQFDCFNDEFQLKE